MAGASQEVPDRRRMPARPALWGRVRSRIASSWLAICCSVRSGAAASIQTTSLTKWFKLSNCPPQPLNRPARGLAAVQDPDDITPRPGRTHPPHGRQPPIQLRQDAVKLHGIFGRRHPADRGRIPGWGQSTRVLSPSEVRLRILV